jgi:hypothetical protein
MYSLYIIDSLNNKNCKSWFVPSFESEDEESKKSKNIFFIEFNRINVHLKNITNVEPIYMSKAKNNIGGINRIERLLNDISKINNLGLEIIEQEICCYEYNNKVIVLVLNIPLLTEKRRVTEDEIKSLKKRTDDILQELYKNFNVSVNKGILENTSDEFDINNSDDIKNLIQY